MTTNSNDVLELSPESNKSTDKRITNERLKGVILAQLSTQHHVEL